MTDHETPEGTSRPLSPLQAYMAERGDGLDPRMIEALAQKGSVSGPAPNDGPTAANIINVDFRGKRPSKRSGKQTG
ncbi:hypothetical protein [Labrenzia sp. CE80]|uniref:hypothetical protein n=1 Tax=Labrenzia sp. CE80 TaxID=1788986 RepID=UPI00129B3C75|nr:hypothetical protein [Labrenzia sp. CE80]